jgi:phosphatidylglycerol:prolipoprotein diacylglycerol transferase
LSVHPEIAHWGFIHIRSYGVMLALAFLVGTWLGLREARRLGLDEDRLINVILIVLVASVLGAAIGRVGCHLNGCCYGRPTTLPWGVVFPPDSYAGLEFGNAAVHPSQLYMAAAGVALFALTWSLRRRLTVPGTLFWLFIVAFALIRIPIDMTRAYEPEATLLRFGSWGVTESQLTSLAMALFGLLMMVRIRRSAAARA